MANNLNETVCEASPEAKRILTDGKLLETTEALALRISNNYDFARRIAQEFSLILMGQTLKFLNIGQLDRAYSHVGLYAPPGLGKDYAWRLIETSNIFRARYICLLKQSSIQCSIGSLSTSHKN